MIEGFLNYDRFFFHKYTLAAQKSKTKKAKCKMTNSTVIFDLCILIFSLPEHRDKEFRIMNICRLGFFSDWKF